MVFLIVVIAPALREEQDSNIDTYVVTAAALLNRGILCREEHHINVYEKLVTRCVSNNGTDCKELQ